MSTSDVFALEKFGLNTFLFADVGTEMNGSKLTVLSVLARLGQDPWELAGQWAKLPKATTIARLTESIVQMPLSDEALRDAGLTAKRLILLLPAQAVAPSGTGTDPGGLPRWIPAVLAAVMLALSVGVTVLAEQHPNVTAVALSEQSIPARPSAPAE